MCREDPGIVGECEYENDGVEWKLQKCSFDNYHQLMSLYYSLVDNSNSFCGLAVDCIAYVCVCVRGGWRQFTC